MNTIAFCMGAVPEVIAVPGRGALVGRFLPVDTVS